MKRYFSGVAALLMLLSSVSAVDAQFLRVGVGGGPSTPVLGFADAAQNGFHVQGMLGLRLPLIPVSIRGDLLYQQFPLQAGGSQRQVAGVVNGFMTVLPIPIITPYLTGGVGLYHTSQGERPLSSGADAATGINVGAGVRLGLGVVDGFVEARYHHLLAEGAVPRAVPVTVGVMF